MAKCHENRKRREKRRKREEKRRVRKLNWLLCAYDNCFFPARYMPPPLVPWQPYLVTRDTDNTAYWIGDDASVWKYRTNRRKVWHRLLTRKKHGLIPYCTVTLWHDKRLIDAFVHRLVLEAFVGLCPPGMECCHTDGNPLNNSPANLRWDTQIENMLDRKRHGRDRVGVAVPNAKLTPELVRQIRALRASGETYSRIAKRIGVSLSAVWRVVTRRLWNHVT